MPLRGEGNSVDLIKAGKVAQAIYWFAAASWWRATPFDWDVAPAPAGPSGSTAFGVVDFLGIAQQSKDRDAAWALTTFLSAPEIDAERAFGFGNMVVRPSAVPAWRERMKTQKPKNLDLIEETVKTLSLPALRKPHPLLPDVDKILTREVTALIHDGRPVEQVVNSVATEGNNLLGVK
jgi:ABC-type glycerol-3-phosphate transport system substrate-binding protein